MALFTDAGPVLQPRRQSMPNLAARHVRVEEGVLRRVIGGPSEALAETPTQLDLELFAGEHVRLETWRVVRNRSGSVSWIGRVPEDPRALAVLVHRDGVTVGSIRVGGEVYMLYYAGRDRNGEHLHALYQVDLGDPRFREDPPTEVEIEPERLQQARELARAKTAGDEPQDDGSVQDLMVVYTPLAVTEAGGTVALENLIDLGVTETNLSYENSGVFHRINLVYKGLIDYDEMIPSVVDLRDRLQLTDDGHMDEVHPLRDQVGADLVKLVYGRPGSCGRAFIMSEVSLAHAAFAFDITNQFCISPIYSFQHELGHVQGGRHSYVGDSAINMPFTFNHGYRDVANEFHTIMAAHWQGCDDCVRLLYWSNPDVNEPVSGAPMGVPEGQPEAADNRKTLNLTAWTVANFRLSKSVLLSDDFESGDLMKWAAVEQGIP